MKRAKAKGTYHFQDKSLQRGINFDHIKQAIKSPDFKEESFGNIKVRKKIDEDRTITVIYFKNALKPKNRKVVVVTAYYNDG